MVRRDDAQSGRNEFWVLPVHPRNSVPNMRVRITKPLSGSIDGIQLDHFVIGLTYDVGTTLGNYLLAECAAVPVEQSTPALVLPIHDVAEVLFPKSKAADAPGRRSRKKR